MKRMLALSATQSCRKGLEHGELRCVWVGQREKDQKLEELNHLRNHEIACTKLKHQLDLELKRDKVSDSCRRSAAEFKRSRSSWVFLVGSAEYRASIWMQTHMFSQSCCR